MNKGASRGLCSHDSEGNACNIKLFISCGGVWSIILTEFISKSNILVFMSNAWLYNKTVFWCMFMVFVLL